MFFSLVYTCSMRIQKQSQKYILKDRKAYFITYEDGYQGYRFISETVIRDADIDTFKIIDEKKLAVDKNNIYILGKTKEQNKRKYDIYNADLNTFKELSYGYYKDKNYVYYNYMIIPGADPASFAPLENEYFMDKKYIYYEGKKLKNSDSRKSFESIYIQTSYDSACRDTYELYAENNGKRYHFGEVYNGKEYDVKTFISYDYHYSKDKNYVYYYGKKLDNVDSKSFILYDSDYFADKYRVYNNRQVIKGSDVDTFVIIDSYYSKDKNHVYYENKIVPEADPETFGKIEKYGYYADKNYIYTKDGTIENYK